MKAAIFIIVLTWMGSAHSAEKTIGYDYQEINEPRLVSINTHNEKAKWTAPDSTGFRAIYVNMQGVEIQFECGLIQPPSLGDTMPSRINEHGQIIGNCVKGDFNTRNGVTFIRERSGLLTIIQKPGADHTDLFGINNRGQGAGVYWNPLEPNKSGLFRLHGVIWDRGQFITVDLPSTDPLRPPVTQLFGLDDQGRAIGLFYMFDPATNETTPQQWFLYDNGAVTWLSYPGSAWTDLQDINGVGQIVGNSSLGAFFWDDGNFYRILPPTGKAIVSVDSIDDASRIIGRYRQDPCPPYPQSCVPTQFLATPTPTKQRGKGKPISFVDMR